MTNRGSSTPSKAQVVDQFILDLTKEKIDPRGNRESLGFGCDPLEYSADDQTHQSFLRQLREEERAQQAKRIQQLQQQQNQNPQQIHSQAIIHADSGKQPEKKRQRKAIFDKYKPSENVTQKSNIMSKFDQIFLQRHSQKSKITIGQTTSDISPTTLPSIDTANSKNVNMNKYVEAAAVQDSLEVIEPNEEHRFAGVLNDSPVKLETANSPRSNTNSKFDIRPGNESMMSDRFSRIYGGNEHQFLDSRDSKDIVQDLLNENIFSHVDANQSMRISLQADELIRQSINNNTNNAVVPKAEQIQVPPKPATAVTKTELDPSPQLLVSQIKKPMSATELLDSNASNLSRASGLTEVMGKLKQIEFLQPTSSRRICDLLQESWRLNSVCFNFNVPDHIFSIASLRHKEHLRSLVLQQIIAAGVLMGITEQLIDRKRKHQLLITNFRPEIFKHGEWYNTVVSNLEKIKSKEPHPLRKANLIDIKQALRRTDEASRKISRFLEENFRVEKTEYCKNLYINLRKTIDQIQENLKKMSEDLYFNGVWKILPQHFYSFFEYLRQPFLDNPDLPLQRMKELIDERQMLLGTIQLLRNAHDPLCCSSIRDELEAKAMMQINRMRSRYFNKLRLKGNVPPTVVLNPSQRLL